MGAVDRTIVGDLARALCLEYPAAPTQTLARKLHKEHPQVYPTLDRARGAVRYYRGTRGAALREHVLNANTIVERHGLPTPEPSVYKVEPLPEDVERWCILADLHVPFHDPRALGLVFDWLKKPTHRVDGVLILGDLADCYTLSSWLRDPTRRRFAEEMENIGAILDAIKKKLKPKRIVWKGGNHEDRLQRYLCQHAPELLDVKHFTWRSFLNLDERGVQWVESRHPLTYHALMLLHGHEWGAGYSTPVNPARSAFLRTHECTVVAHQHQTSEHTEPTAGGRTITCWSIGCLCDLHPEYRVLNRWNLGFAELDTTDDWRIINHRIVKDHVL